MQEEVDGSNEYNNFQHGSINTTKQLIQDLENIDLVFHIGDICYANGYLSQWDQFTAQVEPVASTVPYMIARFSFTLPQNLVKDVLVFHEILCCCWCSSVPTAGTMSETGLGQDPFMKTWILVGNVVCWQRLCSMSLLQTGLSSGMVI